jgi:hypothetical protein
MQCFLEEALGGSRVTGDAEQKINRSAGAIDAVERVNPLGLHPKVGLIHPPEAVGGLQFRAASIVQFGRVALDPTPDGGVVGRDAPLGEEFLDATIGQGESQMPAHRTGNDGRFEVAPLEQGRPSFAHQGIISAPSQPDPSFATLPHADLALANHHTTAAQAAHAARQAGAKRLIPTHFSQR